MTDLSSVRAKIRALQAKTLANGCTPAEVAAAEAAVAKLIRKHGLDRPGPDPFASSWTDDQGRAGRERRGGFGRGGFEGEAPRAAPEPEEDWSRAREEWGGRSRPSSEEVWSHRNRAPAYRRPPRASPVGPAIRMVVCVAVIAGLALFKGRDNGRNAHRRWVEAPSAPMLAAVPAERTIPAAS